VVCDPVRESGKPTEKPLKIFTGNHVRLELAPSIGRLEIRDAAVLPPERPRPSVVTSRTNKPPWQGRPGSASKSLRSCIAEPHLEVRAPNPIEIHPLRLDPMEHNCLRFVHEEVSLRDAVEQRVLLVLNPELPGRTQRRIEGARAHQSTAESHIRAADRRFLMDFRAVERRAPSRPMVVKRQRYGVWSL
jgi:hypothetical protein